MIEFMQTETAQQIGQVLVALAYLGFLILVIYKDTEE
jgi:hypothetical protein